MRKSRHSNRTKKIELKYKISLFKNFKNQNSMKQKIATLGQKHSKKWQKWLKNNNNKKHTKKYDEKTEIDRISSRMRHNIHRKKNQDFSGEKSLKSKNVSDKIIKILSNTFVFSNENPIKSSVKWRKSKTCRTRLWQRFQNVNLFVSSQLFVQHSEFL